MFQMRNGEGEEETENIRGLNPRMFMTERKREGRSLNTEGKRRKWRKEGELVN